MKWGLTLHFHSHNGKNLSLGMGYVISIHTLLSDYLSMPQEVNLCKLISNNKGLWKPWKDSLHTEMSKQLVLAHLVRLFAPSERLWWTGCRPGEIMLGRPSPDPMAYDLSLLFNAQLFACFGHESIYLFCLSPTAVQKTRKIANKQEQATTTFT